MSLRIRWLKQLIPNVGLFQGINGNTWQIATKHKYQVDNPTTDYTISPGNVSLCMNHWRVWQHAMLCGNPHTLVLEDDFDLKHGMLPALYSFINNLPADYDLAFCGHLNNKTPKKEVSLGISKLEGGHHIYGTHAYLVSNKALQMLIDTCDIAWAPIDILLNFKAIPKLNTYLSTTSIIDQESQRNNSEKVWTKKELKLHYEKYFGMKMVEQEKVKKEANEHPKEKHENTI